ncbi:MAG TPA: hypothetical protein VFI00_17295 [Kribbella sp.]|nr:hypothetical protein [Kribbella sp.]
MKRVLLTGLLVLAVGIGVTGGYFTGDYLETPLPTASGNAAPLGAVSPSEPLLPVKTPVPNNLAALQADDLDFREQRFTVHQESLPPVRLSVQVPSTWAKSVNKNAPGEVKFLDSLRERGLRVESGFRVELTPAQQRDRLIAQLKSSLPYEDDFQIVSQTDDSVTGDDGQPRSASTLIYTYIPTQTVRYVMVRWVATSGDGLANVEMSITGLPQDAKALALVADEAAKSVTPED